VVAEEAYCMLVAAVAAAVVVLAVAVAVASVVIHRMLAGTQ
jgi:hypothetical protein